MNLPGERRPCLESVSLTAQPQARKTGPRPLIQVRRAGDRDSLHAAVTSRSVRVRPWEGPSDMKMMRVLRPAQKILTATVVTVVAAGGMLSDPASAADRSAVGGADGGPMRLVSASAH